MNKNELRPGTRYVFQVRKGEPHRRGLYKGVAADGRLAFDEGGVEVMCRSGHYVLQVAEESTEDRVNDALTQADFLAKAKELELIVLLLHNANIHAGIGAVSPRGQEPQVSLFIPYDDAHRLGDLLRDHLFQDYDTPQGIKNDH
jgi:hypothetical protein